MPTEESMLDLALPQASSDKASKTKKNKDKPSKEKPHYTGHRGRLRERFLKNPESLADYELLEMLLFVASPRGDVKPLAKQLIAEFGTLAKVCKAAVHELSQVKGMNDQAIAAIKVMDVIHLRNIHEDVVEKPILESWKSLLDYCRESMAHLTIEQFRIIFLDKKHRMITNELQQEGTIDHTPVYPREVVKRALELGASAIILVHNHPSGDPQPSKADINITKEIMMAAAPLHIEVHDHLIIGGKKHFSLASHGLM